jgi:hypothetical protein
MATAHFPMRSSDTRQTSYRDSRQGRTPETSAVAPCSYRGPRDTLISTKSDVGERGRTRASRHSGRSGVAYLRDRPVAALPIELQPIDTRPMIYEGAGDPTTNGSSVGAHAALDWAGASNLNTCWRPQDVDAAFDRDETHVGVAVIALVYNNTDTPAVLPRVARALTSTNPRDAPAGSARLDAYRAAARPGRRRHPQSAPRAH